MAVVGTRTPVVVSHPITQEFIALSRGMEFRDDDPVVTAYPWAFEDEPAREELDSVPIESATAAPGERRHHKRK